MGTDQQTAIVQQRAKMFGDVLQKGAKQLAAALPRHIPSERFIRIVLTTLRRNPMLMECSPDSVFGAIMQSAQDGLEIDGTHAALVPYRNHGHMDAQYQPMYRGLIALARRSGEISTIRAHEVYDGDVFTYELGLRPVLRHIPADCDDPDKITHFYAVCTFKDGGEQFEVMTRSQVDAIRNRSRASGNGPWVTDYPAMGRKTVLRRLLKMCPTSSEVQRVLSRDEAADRGEASVDYDIPDIEIPSDGPAQPAAPATKPADKLGALADQVRSRAGGNGGSKPAVTTTISKPRPGAQVPLDDGPPPDAGDEYHGGE